MGLPDTKLPLYTVTSHVTSYTWHSKIALCYFIPSLPPMSYYYNLATSRYPNVIVHSFNISKPPKPTTLFLMLTNPMQTFNSSENFLSCDVSLHIHCTIKLSFRSSFAKSSYFTAQVLLSITMYSHVCWLNWFWSFKRITIELILLNSNKFENWKIFEWKKNVKKST